MNRWYETENFIRGIYPWDIYHQFAINGKISGSVSAVGEMSDVVALLHGPAGCGFAYRMSAHRRYPYYELECTDMGKGEVLLGGTQKLEEQIFHIYYEKHPKLIVVIHSPVCDLLQEDVGGVVRLLREQGIPVIDVQSTNFSHRDKDYCSLRLKKTAVIEPESRKTVELNLKGCGLTEALKALVDQVMIPCERKERTVNFEVLLMKGEVYQALKETIDFLEQFHIGVNCIIPNDPVERLAAAPAASLNIVSRVNWAEYMKGIFGTEFIHYRASGRYYGWDGLCLFYQDIFRKLGLEDSAFLQLKNCEKKYLDSIGEELNFFRNCPVNLYCSDARRAPGEIHLYADSFGFAVKKLYLVITKQDLIAQEITPDVEMQVYERIQREAEKYGITVALCQTEEEMLSDKDYQNVRALLNTKDFSLERGGVALIPPVSQEICLSFESYIRTAKKLYSLIKEKKIHRELLLNKISGEDEFSYPLQLERMTVTSRNLWNEMWYR